MIDSEEKAYWLGFLLADGCLAKSKNGGRYLRVHLSVKDEDHLQKLKEAVGYGGPVVIRRVSKKSKHFGALLILNSKEMCSSLLEKGWDDFKKSGGTRILSSIQKGMRPAMVRGLVDGDGGLSVKKKNGQFTIFFCDMHRSVVEWAMDFILKIGVTGGCLNKPKKANCWSFRYEGNRKVKQIVDVIKGTPCLDRKAELMGQVMAKNDNLGVMTGLGRPLLKNPTRDDIQFMYEGGMSLKEISSGLKVSVQAVRQYMVRHGIARRTSTSHVLEDRSVFSTSLKTAKAYPIGL